MSKLIEFFQIDSIQLFFELDGQNEVLLFEAESIRRPRSSFILQEDPLPSFLLMVSWLEMKGTPIWENIVEWIEEFVLNVAEW